MTIHSDPRPAERPAPGTAAFKGGGPTPDGAGQVRQHATAGSVRFQSPDPIDVYLDELRRSLRLQPNAVDLVDETEDHLREALAHQLLGGVDPVRAQQVVLAEFGDPRLVANALVRSRTRTVPQATPLTRLAGRAGAVAGAAWVIAVLVNWWQQSRSPWTQQDYVWFQLVLFFATLLTALLVVGLIARAGALRTAWSVLALLLLVVAMAGNAVTSWLWPLSNLLLSGALAAAAVLSRLDARPANSTAVLWPAVLIWPLACAVTFAGKLAEIGPVDEYGDFPMLYEWSFLVAAPFFAGCCLRLGTALAGEPLPQRWTDVIVLDPTTGHQGDSSLPNGDHSLAGAGTLWAAPDAPQPPSAPRWAPPD